MCLGWLTFFTSLGGISLIYKSVICTPYAPVTLERSPSLAQWRFPNSELRRSGPGTRQANARAKETPPSKTMPFELHIVPLFACLPTITPQKTPTLTPSFQQHCACGRAANGLTCLMQSRQPGGEGLSGRICGGNLKCVSISGQQSSQVERRMTCRVRTLSCSKITGGHPILEAVLLYFLLS